MRDEGFRSGRQQSKTIWTGAVQGGVCLSLFEGEILFSNGQRATCAGVETIEAAADAAFVGHLVVTLPDGSVSRQDFSGHIEAREGDSEPRGTGVWRFGEGSGQFAGLTGGGTFFWSLDGDSYQAEFSG